MEVGGSLNLRNGSEINALVLPAVKEYGIMGLKNYAALAKIIFCHVKIFLKVILQHIK